MSLPLPGLASAAKWKWNIRRGIFQENMYE